MSLAFHVLVLLACLRLTFPILGQPQVSLFASPTVFPDDPSIELSEIEFEQKEWDDLQTRQVVFEETQRDFADDLLSDLLPAEPAAATATLTDLGLMDADLGGRAARGSGDAAAGGRGGPLGATTFFGTRSRGDRLVFVVDNSSSMKGGRLEAAVVELVRSINAMVPRQSFYVIFVSDQTYPMFYPDRAADLAPATAANKKLLGEWLQKVRLASGKNRELITAMDLAASLRPHAVFLLWDGRIDDQTVRRDVLTHLTRPNQWNFPIHTLGMGTLPVESEQNLAAIAQAHGGMYRRVAIPQPSGR